MSRIKATQLLKVEDFPDQRGWIAKLVSPINDFINQSIKILNGGITFADNTQGKELLFSFTYQSESITFPQLYAWGLSAKPIAFQVVSAFENGVPVIVNAAFEYTTDGKVSLVSVVKFTTAPAVALLTANTKYQIRVRVTP